MIEACEKKPGKVEAGKIGGAFEGHCSFGERVGKACGDGGVGHLGPGGARCVNGGDPGDPRLGLAGAIMPGEPRGIGGDPGAEPGRARLGGRGKGAILEDQRAEAAATTGKNLAARRIDAGLDGFADARRKGGRQARGIEGGGEANPRSPLRVEAGRDQKRGAGERIAWRKPRATAAREPETARLAAPRRDAIGKCGGQQAPGCARIEGGVAPVSVRDAEAAAIVPRRLTKTRDRATGIAPGVSQKPEAKRDIGGRIGPAERVSFLQ